MNEIVQEYDLDPVESRLVIIEAALKKAELELGIELLPKEQVQNNGPFASGVIFWFPQPLSERVMRLEQKVSKLEKPPDKPPTLLDKIKSKLSWVFGFRLVHINDYDEDY